MVANYPKVYNLGTPETEPLRFVEVSVEEKVDGSQFGFCLRDGAMHMRTRSTNWTEGESPTRGFELAHEVCVDLLKPTLEGGGEDIEFRAEFLRAPRHNHLTYERTPRHHLILFDAFDPVAGGWLNYDGKKWWSECMDIEVVPQLAFGVRPGDLNLESLLRMESVLGRELIEGVVLKPTPPVLGRHGERLLAKYVSPVFRERAGQKAVKIKGGKVSDVIAVLVDSLATEPRYRKAMQHLEERGELTLTPKDIGPLIREVCQDIEEEEKESLKRELWAALRKDILKGASRPVPAWYQSHLAERILNVA